MMPTKALVKTIVVASVVGLALLPWLAGCLGGVDLAEDVELVLGRPGPAGPAAARGRSPTAG